MSGAGTGHVGKERKALRMKRMSIEILTVSIKIVVFHDVTSYNLVDINV
jgi:hypothetical protein